MNNILLTICARGGSKGVPQKNIRSLAGQPLIVYTIKQALNWRKAKHVIVSTNSRKIAEISRTAGAEVPFMRPRELARDTSGKLPVLRHALLKCEKKYQEQYDIVVDLDPTSPVRTLYDLNSALELFLSKKTPSLFSVVLARKNPYFNMVEINKKKQVVLCKKLKLPAVRRQDCPKVYDMNASIYIYRRKYLINKKHMSPINHDSQIYVMQTRGSLDIDHEIDFKFTEFLLKEKIISL